MNDQPYQNTPIWYEQEKISKFIPRDANCQYLRLPKLKKIENTDEAFLTALKSPLKIHTLENLVSDHYQPGETIAVLIDDNTRPNIHTRVLLPLLSHELIKYGVNEADIKLIVATGTHTPPTPAQIKSNILGDLYESWKARIWVHDCDDKENHINLGFSESKTPIFIDKRVFSSCIIIPLSDSEYHYFAGIAGSVKLFVPGVSARQTVRVNHSRIFDLETGFKAECRMGNIKDNVSMVDIRSIVKMLINDHNLNIFVIDAIMSQGELIEIIAGNPISIQDNALSSLAKMRSVGIDEKADLLIVGKPSVNFYQAGKAINSASHAIKQGGQMVILAGCLEGFGPDDYLDTMNQVKSLSYLEAMQWVIKNKCTETTFEIGIQNAVDIFRVLQLTDGKIHVYSELNQDILSSTFRVLPMNKIKSPEQTMRLFVKDFIEKNPEGLIYVLEDFNLLATSS
jgi:nickel-dependent lactate racemase